MENTTKTNRIELPSPLFRDPIYDAPTDPVIVRNHKEENWYLFYTQRRAADVGECVSWVHGTKIGVATSKDGAKWLYRGTLEGLDTEPGHNTFWAPAIFYGRGEYHMYVTYITGIPTDWEYPRSILHYTSDDLWHWKFQKVLDLKSSRVIDACVKEIAPGKYKMWYKNENAGSHIFAALSEDLYNWEVAGEEVSDCAQEGPVVFDLEDKIFMITDFWHGLAVYSSLDYTHFQRCGTILEGDGIRPWDQGFGHHAEVVKQGGKTFLVYFTHPFLGENNPSAKASSPKDAYRSCVQIAQLILHDHVLVCDRNAKVFWDAN